MSFIMDAGCGSSLIALQYIKDAGMMGRIAPLATPITLNTAGSNHEHSGR